MDKKKLAEELIKLHEVDMLDVLEIVFSVKTPYPEEKEYHKNHFFLGVANSVSVYDETGSRVWSDWEVSAVAYLDKIKYPNGMQGQGFWQYTTCLTCKTPLCSSGKQAFCSVCGAKNWLT